MNMSEITDTLIKAKALIDTPEKWCKYDMQRLDRLTHQWQYCSLGALDKAAGIGAYKLKRSMRNLFYETIKEITGRTNSLGDYNDYHTHEEVMQLWDKVIEESKK